MIYSSLEQVINQIENYSETGEKKSPDKPLAKAGTYQIYINEFILGDNTIMLEMDKNSFDNVAWQIRNPAVNIVADPNYFKVVEVPVSVIGEINGKVLMQKETSSVGQGRIIIRILKDGKQIFWIYAISDFCIICSLVRLGTYITFFVVVWVDYNTTYRYIDLLPLYYITKIHIC